MSTKSVNIIEGNLKKYYNYSFPKLAVLVTLLDNEDKPNIITLAWHSPVSIKPPMYGVSIDTKRYSHDPIRDTGEFVVNFCEMSMVDQVHYCGRHSGRKVNKFQETGLTPVPARVVKPPLIAEAYSHIECKLIDHHQYGDHTWFAGEVVAVSCTDKNTFEADLMTPGVKPTLYLGNNTYTSFHGERKRFER
jgi:flavin reductase (DIM6/NTAB) family NADH-FMN oxidoreductase RutF